MVVVQYTHTHTSQNLLEIYIRITIPCRVNFFWAPVRLPLDGLEQDSQFFFVIFSFKACVRQIKSQPPSKSRFLLFFLNFFKKRRCKKIELIRYPVVILDARDRLYPYCAARRIEKITKIIVFSRAALPEVHHNFM